MGIMDWFRGAKAPPAPEPAPSPGYSSEFMRGNRGVTFTGWRPALRETQDDVSAAWGDAAARTIDLVHNSGWIAGIVEQAVANTIGSGLRLRAMPENDLFGMDNTSSSEWRKLVEAKFDLWANNPVECDIEGRRTFGEMQGAAFRSWFATGDIFGEVLHRRRYGSPMGTKVRVVPPTRMSNDTDTLNRVVQGVRMDADGMPIAYRAWTQDPLLGRIAVERPARDVLGRPMTVHVFLGMPGQVRGITPLAPALQVARQFDQLADSTLTAALVQTVFAAAMTSEEPTEETMAGLLSPTEQGKAIRDGMSPFDAWADASSGWYEGASIDIGIKGRVAHLFPGQKLEFLSPAMPAVAYKEFSMHLLREICRCAGLTFESGTGDYTGATYSSVRMATTEIYAITIARRRHIVSPFAQPIYEAWLEEAIEVGTVPFPGGIEAFRANRLAACRAEWRGSPKPQADDLKTAKAHEIWRAMGVISDQYIADDLGLDIEDTYAQRQREKDLRAVYGIPEPAPMAPAGGSASDGADQGDPNG